MSRRATIVGRIHNNHGDWFALIYQSILNHLSWKVYKHYFWLMKWKWNEAGFRPPLCTYRLNWARRTSWELWDEWDDTVLQTQDSKFGTWRSEAEYATSQSRRLPTLRWERNIFVSFKPPRPRTEPRALAWKAAVLTTTVGPPPIDWWAVTPENISWKNIA